MSMAMIQTQEPATKEALKETLEKNAIHLINQIAGDTSLEPKKMLTQIEQYLKQNTLLYLEETWEQNQPTTIVSIFEEEIPQDTATIQELSSSEEDHEK